MPQPLTATPSRGLSGRIRVPGDKSISHRALILGALATRTTRITGLLEADDVLATARAVDALGAEIARESRRSQPDDRDLVLDSIATHGCDAGRKTG